MKEVKFIKKRRWLSRVWIKGAEEKIFFNENGEEYKSQNIPERTKKQDKNE